jgi:sigma-B regulation protein RsbQ
MGSDVLKRNNVSIEGNLDSSDTIVFAHGFGSDQTAWKKISPGFENRYRLVLFDHVGAGDADQNAYSASKYASIEAYAVDLIEICSSLNLKNATFVGHSVGAMIGLLAAISVPGLFPRLILIGASPRYLNDKDYIGGFTQDFAGWTLCRHADELPGMGEWIFPGSYA